MKVCYFIQAHKNPRQIYRLVRTIKKLSPNAQVLIGYDFTNSSFDITPLQDVPDIYLLKGEFPVRRGEFSALQPYLNAINWLFEHNFNFDWLAYISGQDYPVRPLSEVEEQLAKTKYDGFIQFYNVLSEESQWTLQEGKKRYFRQYYRCPSWSKWLVGKASKVGKLTPLNFVFTYGMHIGVPAFKIPFNENFYCYGGNHRHFLSRKCTQFLKNYIESNPELMNYYHKVLLPEESFIQTVLVNSQKFNLFNGNKIYEIYSDGEKGHPRTLNLNDHISIKNGDFFFARKFNEDSDLLNTLDIYLLHNIKKEIT